MNFESAMKLNSFDSGLDGESENSRKAGYSLVFWFVSILFASLVCSVTPVLAQVGGDREAVVHDLREVLERPFMEDGGFFAFDCAITASGLPPYPFTCDAVRASGERYQYLLAPDPAEGLIVDMVTEPAGQLGYAWLPAMQAACQRFLEKFNQADWEGMYAGFDASLQELIPVASIAADLTSIRELLGPAGELTLESYSVRNGGRTELQYAVPAQNGKAAFRCGLHASENIMTILAYLIAPYPDTPLYKSNLEEKAAQQLSALIGNEVIGVEIPYQQLPEVSNSAEGVAILANGERVKIMVMRSGRTDDFSQYDFSFAVSEETKP